MTVRKRQIALVHVAKSKLGFSETQYRSALAELCGDASTTELDTAGFEGVIA